MCQLPILFTAENYPAAKVISEGNPKALQLNRGGSESNFLLVGYPGRVSMKMQPIGLPGTTKPYQRACNIFLNTSRGELLDRYTNGTLTSRRTKLPRRPVGILIAVTNRSHGGD